MFYTAAYEKDAIKEANKTIADLEFERMYDETGNYLQKEITFCSTSQPAPISFKRSTKTSIKRVSFSAELNCRKVGRLYENDSERENLWWSASNITDAAASKCQMMNDGVLQKFFEGGERVRVT